MNLPRISYLPNVYLVFTRKCLKNPGQEVHSFVKVEFQLFMKVKMVKIQLLRLEVLG